MRILDVRSGKDNIKVGDEIRYADGSGWRLLAVEDLFFSGTAKVLSWDERSGQPPAVQYVPLRVRFTHPNFFLQRIGFFPS